MGLILPGIRKQIRKRYKYKVTRSHRIYSAMSDVSDDSPARGPKTSPETLEQSARRLLEFPLIRQMLAGQTRFFRSRELADEVTPQVNLEDVLRLQEETSEAVLMLSEVGDIGLTGHEDLRPVFRRAALGVKSALAGQDWATVADLLAYDLDEQITSWTAMLGEMRTTFEDA